MTSRNGQLLQILWPLTDFWAATAPGNPIIFLNLSLLSFFLGKIFNRSRRIPVFWQCRPSLSLLSISTRRLTSTIMRTAYRRRYFMCLEKKSWRGWPRVSILLMNVVFPSTPQKLFTFADPSRHGAKSLCSVQQMHKTKHLAKIPYMESDLLAWACTLTWREARTAMCRYIYTTRYNRESNSWTWREAWHAWLPAWRLYFSQVAPLVRIDHSKYLDRHTHGHQIRLVHGLHFFLSKAHITRISEKKLLIEHMKIDSIFTFFSVNWNVSH